MAYEALKQYVDSSSRIVFFGGAGVSTESGIPDFRSVDGLYHQKYDWPPEEILSHTFFERHTKDFYRFYRDKMLALDARPNQAHMKLAQWEREGKLLGIVTQNIDGLHTAAGNKKVFELHGSVHRNYCTQCGKSFSPEYIRDSREDVPHCDACGGLIKPDVVVSAFNYIFGSIMIMAGLVVLITSLGNSRRVGKGWWVTALFGLAAAILGGIVLFAEIADNVISILAGIALMLCGIAGLIETIRLRKTFDRMSRREFTPPPGDRVGPV